MISFGYAFSVFFFGNPLVSGIVLASEDLKMQATYSWQCCTISYPLDWQKCRSMILSCFARNRTLGQQNTHTIVSGERVKLYNQRFSYSCVTNYPQTWWHKTIISYAPSDPRVQIQRAQLVSVAMSEAAAGRLWGSELESSEVSFTHMFLNGSCCLIP